MEEGGRKCVRERERGGGGGGEKGVSEKGDNY